MDVLRNQNAHGALSILNKAVECLMKVEDQVQETLDSDNQLDHEVIELLKGIGPGSVDSLKNKLFGLTYNNLGCVAKQ